MKLANDEDALDGETFLRDLYRRIKLWHNKQETNANGTQWLILDDMSSLATILGETLVYQFVDSVCALAFSSMEGSDAPSFGLVIRCSNEEDKLLLKASKVDEHKDKTGWIGAGGQSHRAQIKRIHEDWIPWERSLESIDAIIDVVPLTSGYSREAHGRLIFTEAPFGRGWRDAATTVLASKASSGVAWNKAILNYCIQDNGVRAIRLRDTTTNKS